MKTGTSGFADLHSHSTASDGTNPPSINVKLARDAGLAAMAVTDHDTVAGVEEALEEGRRIGIRVVPGVEMSTVANEQDIHILGYFMDTNNSLLLSRLRELRETRDKRNVMIMDKLSDILGVKLTMQDVLDNLTKPVGLDETVGRPHIADLLVKRGFVSSLAEAFERYLGRDGAAFVNPPRIRPEQAIDWIHEAGGAAVIAHPGLYGDDMLVEQLAQYGADGIEAFHADHSEADADKYRAMAEELDLLVTAGSDYHGERGGVVFHAQLGSRKIDASVVDRLEECSRKYRHLVKGDGDQ